MKSTKRKRFIVTPEGRGRSSYQCYWQVEDTEKLIRGLPFTINGFLTKWEAQQYANQLNKQNGN